ncbi:Penicillopepsin [Dactylellina cionopaga]|nr:Penicillopepsin [Dactylellina cionopaga]
MRYSSNVVFVTVLSAACVTAAPVETTVAGGDFSLPVTHNFLETNHNGPLAFNAAIKKWGVDKDLPTGDELKGDLVLEKKVTKRDSSVQATAASWDVEFTVPAKIGSPYQTLKMNVDTGSSDFWVFSTNQPTSQVAGHAVYNPSKSFTSSKMNGYSWSIGYADGSTASGGTVADLVTIGATTVLRQVVEIASTVSSGFTSGGNDGLIGLAFGKLNTVKPNQARTFFENAMYSLSNKLFTAYLRHAAVGAYDFGYIDPKKYNGTIQYAPLANTGGFWEVASNYYKVGNTNYTQPASSTAVIDTGTTLLLVSNAAAKAYYDSIPNAQSNNKVGGYILPCATTSLPAFSFNVGSFVASVSGSNIIYGSSLGTLSGVPYCFGSIQPISGNMFIYGGTFFKQNFAVFDYGNSRFGFAPHAY